MEKNKGGIKIISVKRILKNKLFIKESLKYVAITAVLLTSSIIMILLNYFNNEDKGLTINGIKMLEALQKGKIGVYIDGEVKEPGYIQIPKGSTLEFAINQAKGVTKDADIQNIDVKRVLKNQEKIIIPAIKETENGENNILNSSDRININEAGVEELSELEGIGEKTAEKIIEYRESNKFDNIEEIMEVKGIGKGKFEKIREDIGV